MMTPPTLEPISAPETTQESPVPFLKSLGITPVTPKIRSSDFRLVREDPFLYFLTRRLGLSPAIKYSEALSRGSWFHICLELLFRNPMDIPAIKKSFDAVLNVRTLELKTLCSKLGMGPTATNSVIEVETQDAKTALGWFIASLSYANPNFSGLSKPWPSALISGDFVWLASELDIEVTDSGSPSTPDIIRLDALLYNKKTNKLWILDPKTTSKPAWVRAQICPIEDQTLHYCTVFDAHLSTSTALHEKFNLPADVSFGGMIHLCITKPSIRYGMSDRPWWLVSESKRANTRATANPVARVPGAPDKREWSIIWQQLDPAVTPTPECGKATMTLTIEEASDFIRTKSGVKTVDKKFTGEPSYDIYCDRCRDWFLGLNDHADLREAHMGKDAKLLPINYSYTSASILQNSRRVAEYAHWRSLVKKYAKAPINLENFPRTTEGMLTSEGMTDLSPFYTAPLKDWPRIMREKLIIQSHRDPP